jgi:hypothetical protein
MTIHELLSAVAAAVPYKERASVAYMNIDGYVSAIGRVHYDTESNTVTLLPVTEDDEL